MNDSFDFSCRCNHNVLLSIDRQQKRNDEERTRPLGETAAFADRGRAGIDRCENSDVAYSAKACHENELWQ